MNLPTIIIDCDGVLLNWRDTYVEWLNKHGLLLENDPAEYDFSKMIKIPGTTQLAPKEFVISLSEIFNQTYLLGKLNPIRGAVEAIDKLHKSGYRLKVVSSYTDDFEAMKVREKNLHEVFGPVFQEFVSLPLYSSKKEWLSRQPKDSIFIEDSMKNLEDAIEVGFDPLNLYLIPQDYNEDAYNEHYKVTEPYKPAINRARWKVIANEFAA